MLLRICQALVFLSGFTGLVYQVTWQKYLSNFLGSHAFASALVLTVFFFFLGLGYITLGRNSHRLMKNQFLLYGIFEGLIGIYCLLSPNIFYWLNDVFSFHVNTPWKSLLVDVSVTCLFIGFPTWLMGGTIPVLTEALSTSFVLSHRTHATIYGLNTLGAFAGTIVGGFYLLEKFGLGLTLYYTSFVNIAIGLAAYLISKPRAQIFAVKEINQDETEKLSLRSSLALYGLSFLSGFYFFSLENLFIRVFGLTLGSSVYTYSTVVAAFICAVGLGSLVVSMLGSRLNLRFLTIYYLLTFVFLVLLYLSVPLWPGVFLRVKFFFQHTLMNYPWYLGTNFILILLFLMIPAGLMGMGLPVLFACLRSSGSHLSTTVGKLYAVNSIGSALGALVGGYLVFKYFDSPQIFKINLALILLSVALTILITQYSKDRRWFSLVSVVIVFGVVLKLPSWKEFHFVPGFFLYTTPDSEETSYLQTYRRLSKANSSNKILFTRHDPNTTVHVVDDKSGRGLYVNGKPDAHTKGDSTTRIFTALTPASIAKNLEKVFIVGLGTGLSAGVMSNFSENKSVTVAEISQGVIDSMPFFKEHNEIKESNAHKINIINGDAFRILGDQNEKYDVILCEPSNPWVSGVEKLFTYDFYKMAATRLNPDGIYAQWFSAASINPELFLTILNTFHSVFKWVTIWSAQGAYTILGALKEPEFSPEKLAARFKEYPEIFKRVGFNTEFGVLSNQIFPPITSFLFVDGHNKVQTLERSTLAFEAARGNFALVVPSLDDILRRKLRKPLPPHLKSVKFFYENLKNPPVQFFEDSISFHSKGYTPGLLLQKYELDYSLKYPQRKNSKLSRQDVDEFKYLLGQSSAINYSGPDSKSKLEGLVQKMEALKLMHMFPLFSQFKKLMPKICKDKDCIQLKAKALFAVGESKNLKSDQEIEEAFEKTTGDVLSPAL